MDGLTRANSEQKTLINTASMIADQQLADWLEANAPQEIRKLYDMAHTLTIFRNVGDYAGFTETGLQQTIQAAQEAIDLTAAMIA